MPNYISNAYLVNKGKVVQPGKEVELTEDQAKKLGDKVKEVEAAEKPKKKETKKEEK